MIRKTTKPPVTQRRFGNNWSELAYLCRKVHYWLYTRKQKAKAASFLDRLDRVLRDLPENDIAIIRHEGLALRSELRGELGKSIAHRRQEIELMERLHGEAQKHTHSTRAYMLSDRDAPALQERRAILEALLKAKDQ
jgi:hypothetical protein